MVMMTDSESHPEYDCLELIQPLFNANVGFCLVSFTDQITSSVSPWKVTHLLCV